MYAWWLIAPTATVFLIAGLAKQPWSRRTRTQWPLRIVALIEIGIAVWWLTSASSTAANGAALVLAVSIIVAGRIGIARDTPSGDCGCFGPMGTRRSAVKQRELILLAGPVAGVAFAQVDTARLPAPAWLAVGLHALAVTRLFPELRYVAGGALRWARCRVGAPAIGPAVEHLENNAKWVRLRRHVSLCARPTATPRGCTVIVEALGQLDGRRVRVVADLDFTGRSFPARIVITDDATGAVVSEMFA